MQLTQNFSLEEFACKDGTPVPDQFIPNVQLLAENLQVLRDELKEPLYLNSGYRTPAYNKAVGGKPHSMHMRAMAADIHCKSLTPKQLHAKVEQLIKDGRMKQGGLGLYKSFVHYDVRGTKARWNG